MKSDSFQMNLHHHCGGGDGGGDDDDDDDDDDVIDIVAVSSWALLTASVLRVLPITPPLYL